MNPNLKPEDANTARESVHGDNLTPAAEGGKTEGDKMSEQTATLVVAEWARMRDESERERAAGNGLAAGILAMAAAQREQKLRANGFAALIEAHRK